ncbi:UDP-glycosyltransferase UGT5-like [Euwallacea similis]|uniref:UDP-glycosyltransferase UGT5-like n=1 Tax=Euwallacea similis TaxID=1736056 RepID=UPI00344EDBA7
MNVFIFTFLVKCSIFLQGASSAKVLGVFPFPAGSHYILANKLMTALANNGHEITFITPFPTKETPQNSSWEDIVLDGVKEDYYKLFNQVNMYDDSKIHSLQKLSKYQTMMIGWVNTTLHHPKVRALMDKKVKFDVVITEEMFNYAHRYFAYHFHAPLILLSSLGPTAWVNDILRGPQPLSYVPHFLISADFNFQEYLSRVKNVFFSIILNAYNDIFLIPLHNRLLQQAFPGAPPISELNKHVAFILLNSHESLVQPVPLVPSMVSIGGYHIDPPKALPKDLQKFLDDSKKGVVYFSMGSNLKAKDMSDEKKQIFLNVFSKLKQKVLWKFEDETISGLPDNVFVMTWVPQQDVLAHPNIKLFITHGGLLSTTETIHHGVPVLAIPVFADQFTNALKAVQGGYGLRIGYNDENFNEETVTNLINELLTNPKYTENVKRISNIYHDRPINSKESAIYWVNYVVRHKGAEHLKVAGVKLPLYQHLLLDIVIPLIILLHVSVYFSIKVIRFAYKVRIKSKGEKSKKPKTQ